ncbi:MAG TPA: VWA domain-containing protein [Planctomycetota bacterium]|nr:VWA domain-containing protein [Planctomycetota bacterium]
MFAHPLGLLALLALPAIVALHYFRRRFRPREVSALFLWESVDRTPVSGRQRQPLRSSSSLWLELLAALCLALAFAGPRSGTSRAEHLVFVLDSSASMSAMVEGKSLRDRAIEEVEQRIGEFGARARVSLIASGDRPILLAGPAAFAAEAKGKLRSFEPRSAHHELARSVALALELSGGKRVIVITNRYDPDEFPEAVELIAIGKPADNLAFVHAARTRERAADAAAGDGPSKERVFLSVANWGSQDASTTLTIRAGGRELESREVAVPARGKTSVAFALTEGAPLVEASIAGDALAIDNLVRLAPVPPRALALFCDLAPELRARLGLSDPAQDEGNLERWLRVVPDARIVASAEDAHFAISSAPVGTNTTACLVIEPSDKDVKDFIGPFLVEKRHAAFEGVTLDGVVWSAPASPRLVGSPLVSAGNEVLFSEEREGSRPIWRIKLDCARATLVRSPDWPILLSNLAEARRAELPGFSRTSVQIGESLTYRGGPELAALQADSMYLLTSPSGKLREIAPRSELWIDGVEEPGVYSLAFGATKLGEFAASFVDGRESDLSSLSSGRRPAQVGSDSPALDFSWIELAFAAAGLLFVCGDFWVLSRATRRLSDFEATPSRA